MYIIYTSFYPTIFKIIVRLALVATIKNKNAPNLEAKK